MKALKHFITITRHRWLVRGGCFRIGLYWQGLIHDLSKYSATEFGVGAKYYQGVRSPNAAERDDKGYSEAWMHHKGRNRHHYEYWTDMNKATRVYEPMDRRAACMVYQGKNYHPSSALEYFDKSREKELMHPQTKQELGYILTMLAEKGEKETFRFLKHEVLKGKPFPWEKE